ncbi:MAG: Sortase family protein [candidate division WS6 bacterium OLB21]|uniref:Sortase family protein n=1 Tax=candidate division WS6 bacterium OLB21 TaxID=1617427 RepID=A0A136KFU4_9BACT|nr:MAG: Sortase family protein [candidate division WS6 bacterium OLB21]
MSTPFSICYYDLKDSTFNDIFVPITKYTKAPVKYIPFEQRVLPSEPAPDKEIVIEPQYKTFKTQLTLWDIISGLFNDFTDALVKSRVAGLLLPLILILFGVNIIYREVWPEVEQQIKYTLGYYDLTTVPLVAGDYIERRQFLSNPGSQYFAELNEQAESAHVLTPDPDSNNYNGRFKLSIPALGLSNLPVTANVDSGNEAIYDSVLTSGLAHFKGTGLPISDVDNNIVIYGHSSSGDYYERTRDVAGAFSLLNKIKIGDEIEVEIEGVMHKYRVYRSKIVAPDDISIVTGQKNTRTLTLFTCFPNGNSANRFVAVARPV